MNRKLRSMKTQDWIISQIDTYIFKFWTIQLKILLVPGRCRVPIDYTFMPHDVENLLSIQSIFIYAQDFRYIIVGDGVNCPLHGEKLIFCGPRIISKNKEKTGKKIVGGNQKEGGKYLTWEMGSSKEKKKGEKMLGEKCGYPLIRVSCLVVLSYCWISVLLGDN